MGDITKCTNNKCRKANKCLRIASLPDKYQSYADFECNKSNRYEYFYLNTDYTPYFVKMITHFRTITRHKFEVMKLCWIASLYWQGLKHDLSKYSPIEFFSSVKYSNGKSSPIDVEKAVLGYSLAWLHHRGNNPHHWEYWIDNLSSGGTPLPLPHHICMEMICDWIAAGKTYLKWAWTQEQPETHFKNLLKNKKIILHPSTEEFVTVVLEAFSDVGINALHKKATNMVYLSINSK